MLREKSLSVTDFSEAGDIVNDLYDSLNVAGGVGISAPQIGFHKRIIYVKTPDFSGEMINPVIKESKDAVICNEGCLSFPGVLEKIERYDWIKVEYNKLDGEKIIRDVTGLTAQVVQHEIEHLDGTLLLDKLSRLKRARVTRKVEKVKKEVSGYFADNEAVEPRRVKKNTGLSRKEIKNRRRRRKQNR